jgi:N-acetyl-anhydromuramyl-L-alanine amidase AmpD
MNAYSLGIEVVGYGHFNQYQFIALTDLVQYLMGTFNIPIENVIRHADITQADTYTKARILRDGQRSARKTDIGSDFFPK